MIIENSIGYSHTYTIIVCVVSSYTVYRMLIRIRLHIQLCSYMCLKSKGKDLYIQPGIYHFKRLLLDIKHIGNNADSQTSAKAFIT